MLMRWTIITITLIILGMIVRFIIVSDGRLHPGNHWPLDWAAAAGG
jgi:hypothetical protein